MGIFGWSYPPGCSGTPYDEDYPCEVCGEFEDKCICPECLVCGGIGDPKCYEQHGLFPLAHVIEHGAWNENQWRDEAKREYEAEELLRAWAED